MNSLCGRFEMQCLYSPALLTLKACINILPTHLDSLLGSPAAFGALREENRNDERLMSVRQAKTSSRCRARALLRQTTQRTNSTGIKLQQNSSDIQSFNAAASPKMVIKLHVLNRHEY